MDLILDQSQENLEGFDNVNRSPVTFIEHSGNITSIDFWLEASVPNDMTSYFGLERNGEEVRGIGLPVFVNQLESVLADTIGLTGLPESWVQAAISYVRSWATGSYYDEYLALDERTFNQVRPTIQSSFTGSQVSAISLEQNAFGGLTDADIITHIGDRWIYNHARQDWRHLPSYTRTQSFTAGSQGTMLPLTDIRVEQGRGLTPFSEEDFAALLSNQAQEAEELSFRPLFSTTQEVEFSENSTYEDFEGATIRSSQYFVESYGMGNFFAGESGAFDELTGELTEAGRELLGQDALTGAFIEYDYVGSVMVSHFDDFPFGDAAIVSYNIIHDDAPLYEGNLSINGEAQQLFSTQASADISAASNGSIPFPTYGNATLHPPDNLQYGQIIIAPEGTTLENLQDWSQGINPFEPSTPAF